jgi:5-(carboxyamino)imidazole ribonucleotide synthase
MMALAGVPMGLRFRVLDHAADCCAQDVAEFVRGEFDDDGALMRFAQGLTVATFDFENVPAASIARLSKQLKVAPNATALATAQDRGIEKQSARELGANVGAFMLVDNAEQADQALRDIGLPLILKTRRMGYDGKGQARIRDQSELEPGRQSLGGTALIAEAFVPFKRELSLVAVRARGGNMAFYPLVENVHIDGVLALTLAGTAVEDKLNQQAKSLARGIAEQLDYVGAFALEFFELEGKLLFNEMAPRVHNSGHWSIEGTAASQFENHLRAILDWPLGKTELRQPTAMINCLGAMPERSLALDLADAHWHDYRKQPRVGRKVGHITIQAESCRALADQVWDALAVLGMSAWQPSVHAALERLRTS